MTPLHWPSAILGALVALVVPWLLLAVAVYTARLYDWHRRQTRARAELARWRVLREAALHPAPVRFRSADQIEVERFLRHDYTHPWTGRDA